MDHRTSIVIDAPADVVWAVLSDVVRWPEWAASVERVELLDDAFGLGHRALVKQPGLPADVWEVTAFTPGTGFEWRARSGGVTTVGGHELSTTDGSRTTVELSIHQTGPLAPLARLLFGGITRRYVDLEAASLKRRSETVATGGPDGEG